MAVRTEPYQTPDNETRSTPTMLKNLFIFAGGLVVIFAGVATIIFFLQKNLIHNPHLKLIGTPADRGLRYEDVVLTVQNGEAELHGWFIPNEQNRFTILYFCGNAGNMSYHLDTLKILHSIGLSIFIYDFRGFGESKGRLTEQAMYDDAQSAWEYLVKTRSIPSSEIVVFGRSLGGAMASWVAAKNQPAATIMESSFSSMADMAKMIYPWLPVDLILRWHYDNLSRIGEIKSPLLLIHSREDDLVPYANSERLYEAASEPKQLLTISGDHMEGFLDSGDVYVNGLKTFLDSL